MKKKQIIGLGTLLLVLLLGLFTTSYASITETEFKNFIVNVAIKNNMSEEQGKNFIDNSNTFYNVINLLSDKLDNTNYDIWLYSSGFNVYIYYLQHNNTNKLVYSNGGVQIVGTYNGIQFRVNDNNLYYTFTNNSNLSTNYQNNNNYMYSDLTIYDGWGSNIKNVAPYYWTSSDIFDGPYQDALPFTFIPKPADECADVYYFEDIPLYNASGEDLYLGQLFQPAGTNVVYWTKDNYYYRYGDWNLRQLPVDSIYLEYFTTDNDVAVYDVYLQSKYIYENTIYSSVWADGSTEPYTLAYTNFYIKNNNTIVSNGVVDVSRTFSGDYKDKYDNDLDNQEDVNNISQAINDTINQPVNVSGELGAVFSGDIYDIADSMGFDSTVSIYFTFIEDFLKSVCNVLVDDNDVYFDYSMHGETPTRIYSSDIGLPNGHPLKIFISIVLVFLTVYLLYFQFMKLFEALQTADLSNAIKSQDVSFYIFKM